MSEWQPIETAPRWQDAPAWAKHWHGKHGWVTDDLYACLNTVEKANCRPRPARAKEDQRGTSGVPAGAVAQPSDRERMAAAMEALEDNDPDAAFVILKTALACGAKDALCRTPMSNDAEKPKEKPLKSTA